MPKRLDLKNQKGMERDHRSIIFQVVMKDFIHDLKIMLEKYQPRFVSRNKSWKLF